MTTSPTSPAVREERLLGHAATVELGRRLGRALPNTSGAVLCLSGHLGAGKTTLVKGLAEALGVADADEVTSPTFLRVIRYEGALDLVHVDAYRMQGALDVIDLGLDEDLAGGALVVIEWPEMIEAALPAERLTLELEHVDEGERRARVSAVGDLAVRWMRGLADGECAS